jgi:uncharacterized protein YkwD
MRRVELIEDIFLIILIVFIFGTVFSVTLAFKDTSEPTTVVYQSVPVHEEPKKREMPIQQATALGTLLEEVEETSELEPEEETQEPEERSVEEVAPLAKQTITQQLPEPTVTVAPAPTTQKVTVANNDNNSAYMQELASLIHAQTNAFRKKNGLPALTSDARLEQNAQGHSRQMLKEDFFSHTNTNGCDFTCRFQASGYDAQTWGENLGQYSFSDFPRAESVASYLMKGWQKSSGHRENLLGEAFTSQGIGIAMDNGTIYVTVDFAQPL